MAAIQKIVKQAKRDAASPLFRKKNDKDKITAWRQDLAKVLQVFNVCSISSVWRSLTVFFQTELAINTHTMVADIHRNVLRSQEDAHSQYHSVSTPRIPQRQSAHSPLGSSQVSGHRRRCQKSRRFDTFTTIPILEGHDPVS